MAPPRAGSPSGAGRRAGQPGTAGVGGEDEDDDVPHGPLFLMDETWGGWASQAGPHPRRSSGSGSTSAAGKERKF